MKKLIAIIFLAALLSGCPGAPLAWHVNLMDKIESKTDSFKIELPFTGGEYDLLGFVGDNKSGEYKVNIPAKVGFPIPDLAPIAIPVDFSDQDIGVELTAATLKYELLLKSIGDVGGTISVQTYLTAADGDLSEVASKIGEPISFDLSKKEESFLREVVLSENQLKAINDKTIKIGIKLSGNIQVVTPGEVGIAYELKALAIKDLKFAFDQKIPDDDGEIADFSDTEPIPSQVVGLRLDYTLGLKHDGDFSGVVNVQVFLAPIDETDIFQDKYTFGDSKDLDLSKNEQDISGVASINALQLAAARKDQKLRFGMRIVGQDAGINEGGTVTFVYVLKKADLTAYFTIL